MREREGEGGVGKKSEETFQPMLHINSIILSSISIRNDTASTCVYVYVCARDGAAAMENSV